MKKIDLININELIYNDEHQQKLLDSLTDEQQIKRIYEDICLLFKLTDQILDILNSIGTESDPIYMSEKENYAYKFIQINNIITLTNVSGEVYYTYNKDIIDGLVKYVDDLTTLYDLLKEYIEAETKGLYYTPSFVSRGDKLSEYLVLLNVPFSFINNGLDRYNINGGDFTFNNDNEFTILNGGTYEITFNVDMVSDFLYNSGVTFNILIGGVVKHTFTTYVYLHNNFITTLPAGIFELEMISSTSDITKTYNPNMTIRRLYEA